MSNLLTKVLALFSLISISVQAQPTQPQASNENNNLKDKEKTEIILRDQIDDTDIYAIPFDDSEVEDEEELNRLEKKEVFPLPHSR